MSKEKQDKKPTHQTKYLDDKYIIETIYHNKTPKYAIVNGTGPDIKGFAKPTNELWIQPYADPFGNIEKKAIILPTGVEDYTSTDQLLDDIRTFISSYAYMPEFWLNLCSYYSLLTWIYDRFSSIGYLEFLGDKDSGKTRIGKTISECCYNTIKMNGAGSTAALYRLIERWRGTLFIDEADYRNTEFDSEIAKVINSGYTSDGFVWRCDSVLKNYDEGRAFIVYGPKILSHREKYKDEATDSRCMSYIVPKNMILPKHIPLQLPLDKFSKEGEIIRNKALKWRLDNIRTFEPDLNIAVGIPGRYGEIATSILNLVALTDNPKFRDQFIAFMISSSSESKDSSELSLIANLLRRMCKSNPKHIWIRDVTEEINALYKEMGEKKEVSGKSIGHSVRLLGIVTDRKTAGYRIDMNQQNKEKLDQVFHDYPAPGGV